MEYIIREEHHDTFGFIDKDIYPIGCDLFKNDPIIEIFDMDILIEILDSALREDFCHWKNNITIDNYKKYMDIINHFDNEIYEYILNERIMELKNDIFECTPNMVNFVKKIIIDYSLKPTYTKCDGIGEVLYSNGEYYMRELIVPFYQEIKLKYGELYERVIIKVNDKYKLILKKNKACISSFDIYTLNYFELNAYFLLTNEQFSKLFTKIPINILNKISIVKSNKLKIKNTFDTNLLNNSSFKKIEFGIKPEFNKKIYGFDSINLIQYENRYGEDYIYINSNNDKITLLDFFIAKYLLYPKPLNRTGTYWINDYKFDDDKNELQIVYHYSSKQ